MAHSQLIFPKGLTAIPQTISERHSSQFEMSEASDWSAELLTGAFSVLKILIFLAIVLWPWQVAE
jgi:hypothetical protein